MPDSTTPDGSTRTLRILHLVEPTFAGVRRHMVDLILGFAAHEPDATEQHLIYSSLRADDAFLGSLDDLRSACHTVTCIDFHRGIHPPTDIAGAIATAKYVRKHKIDVIHCHSAKAGYIGRAVARLVPRVSSVYTPNASPFRISHLYKALETGAGYALSDIVIAVSDSEEQELLDNRIVPKKRLRVVYSGIPDRDPSSAPPATEHTPRSSGENRVVVGTVGRISDQKSPLLFAEIVDATIQLRSNAHFVWVGEGELRAELEADLQLRGIADHVTVTGWVSDVQAQYASMDVFILASAYESFGYGTVEAMRAGLPAVVSNVAGSVDVVEDGVTGYIASNFQASSYVEHLVGLIDNPDLRSEMGRAGKDRWRSNFHSSSMVKGTLVVYRELA